MQRLKICCKFFSELDPQKGEGEEAKNKTGGGTNGRLKWFNDVIRHHYKDVEVTNKFSEERKGKGVTSKSWVSHLLRYDTPTTPKFR